MKFLVLFSVGFIIPLDISAFFLDLSYQHPFNLNSDYFGDDLCPPLRSKDVKHFRRVVSYGIVEPDNYVQKGILTNGHFPAEPIVVNKGDTVIVECKNHLDKPFTLHFHGLLQKGTVRSDGVPNVTQKPIAPNGTYYYIINIGHQTGTFVYHAHTELDIVWVFAPFIILEKEYTPSRKLLKNYHDYRYDEERTLVVTQLWHDSADSIYKGLFAEPFQDIPDTDSLLINGKSFGDWGPNNGHSEGFLVIHVEQHKCYRFRIISVASDSAVEFFIANHHGKIIEADGIIINPIQAHHLYINSAQRYSLIYCMNQPVDNYIIRFKMTPGPGPDNGIAILHYKGAPNPKHLRKQIPIKALEDESKAGTLETMLLKGLSPSTSYPQDEIVYPVPKNVDHTIIVRSLQKMTSTGAKYFVINGHFNPIPTKPLIDVIQKDPKDFTPSPSSGIHEIFFGSRVQIVFVNHVGGDGVCEQHPWHLHGHTFHIVGDGPDDFRPEIEGKAIQKRIEHLYKQNLPKPFSFRDVLTLVPNQTQPNLNPDVPCGWIAIRFVADNPGIWLVHCHLTAHLIIGKRFNLYEHKKEDPFLQEQCYFNGHYRKPY